MIFSLKQNNPVLTNIGLWQKNNPRDIMIQNISFRNQKVNHCVVC